ncbi:MAG: hypothetical protein R6U58_03555, partial [Bacteroidales bacterium]
MAIKWKKCLLICLPIVVVGLPLAIGGAFLLAYENKIYPKTQAAGINLEGLLVDDAKDKLREKINVPQKLKLADENETWEIDNHKLKIKYNLDKTAQSAYKKSRQL